MAFYHLDAEYADMILTANAEKGYESLINVETLDTHLKGSDLIKVKRMAPESEFLEDKKDTAIFIMDGSVLDTLREPNIENGNKPTLSDEELDMIIDDAFCKVNFDREKDVLQVNKAGTITVTIDAWRKYGDALLKAYEKVSLVREALEQEEKDKKEAAKEAKKAAKAQKNGNF